MFDIGVDIEDINRFKKYSLEKDKEFLKTIFSDNELKYCFSQSKPAKHLCVRFCAKEAFIKASSDFITQIKHNEIQIITDNNGKPRIYLPKHFKGFSECKVSLSHEKEKAIACVIVTGINQ